MLISSNYHRILRFYNLFNHFPEQVLVFTQMQCQSFENSVRNALNEQFLLYPQCFLSFPKQVMILSGLQYKPFENTVGKGEISCDEQFLLFQQFNLPTWRTFCHFHFIQNCCLHILSVWKRLKFVIRESVKEEAFPCWKEKEKMLVIYIFFCFSPCFLLSLRLILLMESHFIFWSATAVNSVEYLLYRVLILSKAITNTIEPPLRSSKQG